MAFVAQIPTFAEDWIEVLTSKNVTQAGFRRYSLIKVELIERALNAADSAPRSKPR
jgi:hypothetical protein